MVEGEPKSEQEKLHFESEDRLLDANTFEELYEILERYKDSWEWNALFIDGHWERHDMYQVEDIKKTIEEVRLGAHKSGMIDMMKIPSPGSLPVLFNKVCELIWKEAREESK